MYALLTTPLLVQTYRPAFVNHLRVRVRERGEAEAEQLRRLKATVAEQFVPLLDEALTIASAP